MRKKTFAQQLAEAMRGKVTAASAAIANVAEAVGDIVGEPIAGSYEAVCELQRSGVPRNKLPSKYWPDPSERTCDHGSPFWLTNRVCVQCCKECPALGEAIGSSTVGDRMIWWID